MSFKWKCSVCECDIIVPYESPQKMSNYAIPLCKICYEESLKEDIRLNPDFVEQYKQDNGDDIYCTPDGTVFLCRKIKE